MKSLSSFKRILLYRGVVGFRKWIHGLALTVEHELKESLVEDGTLFVFISRNRQLAFDQKCSQPSRLAVRIEKLQSF